MGEESTGQIQTGQDHDAGGAGNQQQSADIEARAIGLGWTPLEQFRGDPDKFVTAEEFVRRGEELMPLLKAQNKRYEQKLRDTEAKVQLLLEDRKLIRQNAYDQAVKDIVARKADAVSRGDGNAYAQLEEMHEKLNRQVAENVQQVQQGPHPDLVSWQSRPENSWYQNDPELTDAADIFGLGLNKKYPTMSVAEICERTSEHIKRAFPHKFPARRTAQTVEGGGRPGNSSGKGYGSLPAEAKAVCDRLVKQGVLTREQYCKDFFEE